MLAAVQVVVQTMQHPIHEVARPVAAPMGVRLEERLPLGAKGPHLLPHHRLAHVVLGPLPQPTQPLRENARSSGAWYAFQTRSRRASKVPFRCLDRSRIFRNA